MVVSLYQSQAGWTSLDVLGLEVFTMRGSHDQYTAVHQPFNIDDRAESGAQKTKVEDSPLPFGTASCFLDVFLISSTYAGYKIYSRVLGR